MAFPSKETPRPSPSRRYGSRVARHLRRTLPCRDERPTRWRSKCYLRGRDAGSRRGVQATPANIVSAVCGDSNPDEYLLFTRGGDGVPIEHVLLQFTMCPRSPGRASSFTGAPIAQLEDVRLLVPTFVRLPAQAFYVKEAVVPAVAQIAPAYAEGGGRAEKLLGPFDVLDDHSEDVEVRTLVHLPYRFVPLALYQHLTPRAAWTGLGGAIFSEGGVRRGSMRTATFLPVRGGGGGFGHPVRRDNLEVVAADKAIEARQMEILRQDLPARFDTGASGGPSPGDAMTIAFSAFEAQTDMLERNRAASHGAPSVVRVKKPEEK